MAERFAVAGATDIDSVGQSVVRGDESAPTAPVAARRHRRLGLEIAASVVVSAAVGLLASATATVLLVAGLSSVLTRYHRGHDLVRAGLPRTRQVGRDTAVPVLIASGAVAAGWWTRPDLVAALAISLAGAAVALVAAWLRRRFPLSQRVVVVGSTVGVAEAATRWADNTAFTLVGSVIVDAEHPRVPSPRTGFTETFVDIQQIDAAELTRARPDMVLVVAGPGINAECIRRVGWALEGTGTALVVQSDLDGIAPHRLEHTSYAGATLMHITSSRPGWFSLALKATMDRLVGALLLLLLAPLLGVLILVIKWTSPGAGTFTQIRVGQDGSLFTMFKLRTMVTSAEAEKAALMATNEGSGLLFKKKADPRVTPLGRVLRKFSLDELPQLINVVRGDMSLVGPRPALPEEVAQYTSLERRRLAAKPGLTGLWQVSGRSDLSWEDAVRLDNHFTENWRPSDDVVILARTVSAVLGSKGAY